MFRKASIILMAMIMTISLSSVVFADNATPGATTLTTSVPDAQYTLNIPADQEITYGDASTLIGGISVTNSSGFATKKDLSVLVNWTPFSCQSTDTTIPFKLSMTDAQGAHGQSITNGTSVLFSGQSNGTCEVQKRIIDSTGGSHYLSALQVFIASTDWGAARGGDYSATITFTAKVINSK